MSSFRELFIAHRLSEVDSGRENNLNLVRFLLATAVILSHSYGLRRENSQEPLFRLLHWGLLGESAVFGFFFVSGYLILRSAVRGAGPTEFLAARFLRIFPALAVAVAFCAFVLGPLASSRAPSRYFSDPGPYLYLRVALLNGIQSSLPGVFANAPARGEINGSLWTLPVEWTMYMSVLVVCIGWKWWKELRRAGLKTWTVVCGCLILAGQMFPMQWNGVLAGCFALGAICYLARMRVILSVPLALILFAVVAFAIRYHTSYIGKRIYPGTLCYLILTLGFHRGLIFKAFQRVGDYSYGLYIFAWPIQQLLVTHMGSALRLFAVSYPVTLVVAILSWHFVEKPCLALKDKFRNRPPSSTAPIIRESNRVMQVGLKVGR